MTLLGEMRMTSGTINYLKVYQSNKLDLKSDYKHVSAMYLKVYQSNKLDLKSDYATHGISIE